MAVGEIGATVADSELQIASNGCGVRTLKITDGIVAIAYSTGSAAAPTLHIKTYPISTAGVIGTVIDTWDASGSDSGWIFPGFGNFKKIRENIYGICLPPDNNLGDQLFKTFTIDTDGQITLLDEDGLVGAGMRDPNFETCANGYIVATRTIDTSKTGIRHESRLIGSDGAIGAVVDSLQITVTGNCRFNSTPIYNSNGFIINGYSNTAITAGLIFTISIDGSGNIGAGYIDSLAIASTFFISKFFEVASGVYGVIYQSASYKTTISTFTVDSSGNIGSAFVDTLVLSTTGNAYAQTQVSCEKITDGYFAFSYLDGAYLKVGTVAIDSSGNIGASMIDTLNIKDNNLSVYGVSGYLTKVNGTAWAMGYDNTDGDATDYEADDYTALTTFLIDDGVVTTSAALTGTITTATESDIVSGGKTIVLTLTGDTWVASGATFEAQRQNIINGIDSAQSEAGGWDAEVKAKMAVTEVVRTSDTVVTITLTAKSGYAITANETITATIPATALTGATQLVASPTFTITNETPASSTLYTRMLMGVGA